MLVIIMITLKSQTVHMNNLNFIHKHEIDFQIYLIKMYLSGIYDLKGFSFGAYQERIWANVYIQLIFQYFSFLI